MPIQPGQRILDKYDIVSLIGQGGMARVWLAKDMSFSGRRVALKQPLAEPAPDQQAEALQRFSKEVRVCALLQDVQVPNIVRAIGVENYEGSPLLILEYMSGGDLKQRILDNPAGLPVEQAISITIAVLQALQGAHDHALSIIHRDVKPSNILFDTRGAPHLGDFGVAQIAGDTDERALEENRQFGAPLYMSPEQENNAAYLSPAAW
jgi:serine/threonine protein kinase